MLDLLIINGHVIDPANGVHQQADVAVADGKIAGVGRVTEEAVMEIDADVLLRDMDTYERYVRGPRLS